MWSSYVPFLAFAVVLTLVPGPDSCGGHQEHAGLEPLARRVECRRGELLERRARRRRSGGLGRSDLAGEPLFEAIKWAGVAYLVYLGVQAIRSAIRGPYAPLDAGGAQRAGGVAFGGWRQGFLSNITNPKVLVFYLAVLPQFMPPGAGIPVVLMFALSHAILRLIYLLMLTMSLHRARRLLARRQLRRGLEATTGAVLLGFSAGLAAEHP